ncbi:hypothetical protein [Aquabacterium sp.]|uniref:hypothetical protein n=1 Tax=Aquabacterium sp. TaxID=1872578 RepID=UPI003BAF289B
MKKLVVALLGLSAACAFAAPNYKNSSSYKSMYECASESLKIDSESDPLISCIGNSHDPSKAEIQAAKDATRDFAKAKANASSKSTCEFSYAIWEANGSRADDWEEGPQKETSLRTVAMLMSSRDLRLYDANGREIPASIYSRWFVKKGYDFQLSDVAKKTCSKKQIG